VRRSVPPAAITLVPAPSTIDAALVFASSTAHAIASEIAVAPFLICIVLPAPAPLRLMHWTSITSILSVTMMSMSLVAASGTRNVWTTSAPGDVWLSVMFAASALFENAGMQRMYCVSAVAASIAIALTVSPAPAVLALPFASVVIGSFTAMTPLASTSITRSMYRSTASPSAGVFLYIPPMIPSARSPATEHTLTPVDVNLPKRKIFVVRSAAAGRLIGVD
jgi:hypothetical protein